MKANEMPKKIYLFDYNDAMVTPIEGDTVYVREDAFIEKASEFFEDHFTEENCKFGISEWTEVKSGFESLDSLKRAFKNYMEG